MPPSLPPTNESGNVYAVSPTLYIEAESLEAADRKLARILDTLPQVVCFGWTSFEAEGEDGASVKEILRDQLHA